MDVKWKEPGALPKCVLADSDSSHSPRISTKVNCATDNTIMQLASIQNGATYKHTGNKNSSDRWLLCVGAILARL